MYELCRTICKKATATVNNIDHSYRQNTIVFSEEINYYILRYLEDVASVFCFFFFFESNVRNGYSKTIGIMNKNSSLCQ